MWQAQFLNHTLVPQTKNNLYQDAQMILSPHFDIPSGFQLGTPQEFPFQGPVFFGLGIPNIQAPCKYGYFEGT